MSELLGSVLATMVDQLRSPSVAFLLGGLAAAALGSKIQIPNQIYHLTTFLLLMRMGLAGGMAIREAHWAELALPALFAAILGLGIVLLGLGYFSLTPGVSRADALATAGLFGAVSSGTLAAALVELEKQGQYYEPWLAALYPIMDIPALAGAVALSRLGERRRSQAIAGLGRIVKDTLRSFGFSVLLLGVVLGLVSRSDGVYQDFYDRMFPGFLTILMVSLGIDAWQRLADLKGVAHWFLIYAALSPLIHGFLGLGLGLVAHHATGLSAGGVAVLAIIAASNSDILGPAVLRAGIPTANPSAYIGASTGIGTPVAVAVCVPLFVHLSLLWVGR